MVDAIEAARRSRGLSVRAAEAGGGLPQRSIYAVLRGHRPSLARADEICRALGITLTIGAPPRPAAIPGGRSGPPVPHPATGDPELAALVSELAAVWGGLSHADRAYLRASFELVRSRVDAAPDRRAVRPAGASE